MQYFLKAISHIGLLKRNFLPKTPNLYCDPPTPNFELNELFGALKLPELGFLDELSSFSFLRFLFSTVGTAMAFRLKASRSANKAASIFASAIRAFYNIYKFSTGFCYNWRDRHEQQQIFLRALGTYEMN